MAKQLSVLFYILFGCQDMSIDIYRTLHYTYIGVRTGGKGGHSHQFFQKEGQAPLTYLYLIVLLP